MGSWSFFGLHIKCCPRSTLTVLRKSDGPQSVRELGVAVDRIPNPCVVSLPSEQFASQFCSRLNQDSLCDCSDRSKMDLSIWNPLVVSIYNDSSVFPLPWWFCTLQKSGFCYETSCSTESYYVQLYQFSFSYFKQLCQDKDRISLVCDTPWNVPIPATKVKLCEPLFSTVLGK